MTRNAVSGKLLSAVTLLLILPVAACDSPGSGGGNRTLTACHVTAQNLSIPGGGRSTAPTLPAGALRIDGSTALTPLFQQAAGNVLNNPADHNVAMNITPNGSGTGLNDVENGTVQI